MIDLVFGVRVASVFLGLNVKEFLIDLTKKLDFPSLFLMTFNKYQKNIKIHPIRKSKFPNKPISNFPQISLI